jgi:hypothetical protein
MRESVCKASCARALSLRVLTRLQQSILRTFVECVFGYEWARAACVRSLYTDPCRHHAHAHAHAKAATGERQGETNVSV